jgi:hypothetical protein
MPPSRTPIEPPPEATKPNTPIAFARSAGSLNALDRTPRHQQPLRAREAAAERGEREERDPEQEQPPVAEQVAEASAQQQEAAKGEEVGVHDPGQRRLGEGEALPDRGQRDVHDRRIEDDHQAAEAKHDQREPAGAAIHVHSVCSFRRSVSRA